MGRIFLYQPTFVNLYISNQILKQDSMIMIKAPTPRPRIMDISPYKGGLTKSNHAKRTIKLSSNETPFGASPKAIQAYQEAASYIHRYPYSDTLCQAIADIYQLDASRIVCGAGSDELISLLCVAYAGPGDDVLYSQYGFLMYPISSMAAGANPIAVPETNLITNVDAILSHVTPNTKIVFIANPNNPTGSYLPKEEILRLRKGLADHILLVLDAAYAEYVEANDYSCGNEIVDLAHNTVVTRTFSKIYGLASLRVGWVYCPSNIADVLNRIRGPFNVSGPAIAAGIAAINDQDFVKKAKDHNTIWLRYMHTELKALGLIIHPSVANFILISFPNGKAQAQAAHEFLMSEGIIARPVANYGLEASIRFTIGLEEDNKAVIEALRTFLNK